MDKTRTYTYRRPQGRTIIVELYDKGNTHSVLVTSRHADGYQTQTGWHDDHPITLAEVRQLNSSLIPYDYTGVSFAVK